MTPDVNELWMKLRAEIGFCHLFVMPQGYLLQTAKDGEIYEKTVPFDYKRDGEDEVVAEFLDFYKGDKALVKKEDRPANQEKTKRARKPKSSG